VAAEEAIRRLEAIRQRAALGSHLVTPWRVVLAGRPNVGKSSLINALLGYPRAIVFDQPGTTRDVVTATAALDGWPIELTDTAGLRAIDEPSADELERVGIARALEQIAAADLLVLVFDATRPWSAEDIELIRRWPLAVAVSNKCDLVAKSIPDSLRADRSKDLAVLHTSAVTGEGIEALGRQITARLVPNVPPAGAAVPFTQRQTELLAQALEAARRGETAVADEHLAALLGD
jgi:tRNA modification GTPase